MVGHFIHYMNQVRTAPLKIRVSVILPVGLVLCAILITTILALPRLAAEHAVACKQCHINPNGGGARNEFGNHAVAFEELCLQSTKKLLADKYKQPRVSEALLVGFDSRWLIFDDPRILRMQSDLYLTFTPFRNFNYHLRLGPVGGNTVQVSEQYALMTFKDIKYWIKAGTFYPSFGLRQDDHTSYTRTKTLHLPNSYWDGISVGAEVHDVNLTAEAFNQNGQGIYNLHAFRAGYLNPLGYLIGGSWQQSERVNGATGNYPRAKALFGALNWDRFTVLGEGDLIGATNDSVAIYGAATARLTWGLYLTGEYNFFDPDRHLKTGTEQFVRLSIDFYPIPFVKIRPSYTHYTPSYLGERDDFFVQLHIGY
jgi:hypothetical protein